MSTKEEWKNKIVQSNGKIIGGCVSEDQIAIKEYIDAGWFYYGPEDAAKKQARDKVSREMRKDGWIVKTESNSLGWFIEAKRVK